MFLGLPGLQGFAQDRQGSGSQPGRKREPLLEILKQYGIYPGISGSLEGYDNLAGGIRTGRVASCLWDLNLNLDLEKTLSIRGGLIYGDLEDRALGNPTRSLVGDLQVFDKNSSDPFLQVFELWYQQILFHHSLRLKLGKVDANSEFSLINNGLDFETSSAHVTPTFFVFPTFPDPMPSLDLFFSPGKLFYASAGVFLANSRDHFLDIYGHPEAVQSSPGGSLLIAESGLTWGGPGGLGRDCNLRIGLWKHTGRFRRPGGSGQQGTQGFYVVLDQTLWKPSPPGDPGRGLRIFLEFAVSDPRVSAIYLHSGGGIEWTGLSAKRPMDALGFSSQYARISPTQQSIRPFEWAQESFYRFQLFSWLNLQADLQYILNPGGLYPHALVSTLQLNLNL